MVAKPTISLAVIVSMAALACGCGDGDEDAGANTVTRAEYLEQANVACRRERADLQEEVSVFLERQRGEKPRGLLYADLAQLVVLPTIENEMEAIRALRPPPGEERRIDRLLYLQELALTDVVYMERVSSISAIEREFEKSAELLRDYGLPDCANDPEGKRSKPIG